MSIKKYLSEMSVERDTDNSHVDSYANKKKLKRLYDTDGFCVGFQLNIDDKKAKQNGVKPPSEKELRKIKLSQYAEKHGIAVDVVSAYLELYVLIYPDKLQSAGYRNLSNRFLDDCFKALSGVDVEKELEERTRPIPFEYAISEDERQAKIVAFCKTNSISSDELENAVKAYLDRYPDKIESNGHKYYSERFLSACMRYQSASKT